MEAKTVDKSSGVEEKFVYLFSEVEAAQKHAGGEWEGVRSLLGGKGANLADMTRLDVPVPPGFTVTTETCNAYLAAGENFPEGLWPQVTDAVAALEEATGKTFGGGENPLLVSCRSGAKFSMPGMMDTVLNIGLNEKTVEGLIELTQDERFVYDCYRRLVQMFGSVVMGVSDEEFEEVISAQRDKSGIVNDSDLGADDWKAITQEFKKIFKKETGQEFPEDPFEQLRLATEAVFKSWNGKRAIDYRNAAGIAHDLGTAVNIQTMVFGNLGEDSATGVAMSRNASTGEHALEGDYLINAQGEDVVAGIRMTKRMAELQDEMPEMYKEFDDIAKRLELHYREMQDMEFTVERDKLWLLQTRDGKRTAQAAVRIAVDMVEEGLITEEEALLRIDPEQVNIFLHPQFSLESLQENKPIAEGLNVSPGAAVGMAAFDADKAEHWAKQENKAVILVRPETKPDDVHGMLAAEGILTSRGGRTSHAALVARQFGTPAVVGVTELELDLEKRQMQVGDLVIKEGDWLSIDGTTGQVYTGQLETKVPEFDNPYLNKLLGWADEKRKLGVRANADYPRDAERARSYGAEGIGLCRTEHMFFENERLPIVQDMILASGKGERKEALDKLLPFQREDFEGLFRAMAGLPVIIRLLDPPLHEFLPAHDDLLVEATELRVSGKDAEKLTEVENLLDAVEGMREQNPMLGLRGVRLGIHYPEITSMQVQAIFEAACNVVKDGVDAKPRVMIPLASTASELKVQRDVLEKEAEKVMKDKGIDVDYKFGTMIEIPRAALTADEIAEYTDFFSFGTNDLTQTTFGISRDDAEVGFLMEYLQQGILTRNPFATIDAEGVGKLMKMAVDLGRGKRPDLDVGICGEHGGDPESIYQCHAMNLDYVSCSPFRIPVARLAAAHAAIKDE
ncbi:MAG: pyruvate, phosphate dikinase [Chloroflexi bacterium]|nr:MAG: pyruvate, phosphate dikinase [Chloroflexota bacterium]